MGPVRMLPAATARAVLAGLRVLGLDAEAVRTAAGLSPEAIAPVDGLVPPDTFDRLMAAACAQAPREELVTELGLAIPFGAFGAIDYLAGSARTVSAAFQALAAHFRYVAFGVSLELADVEGGGGEVRLLDTPEIPAPVVSDEFTLAVFVGRFRTRTGAVPFRVDEVRLTRPAPARPTRHAALLGGPVVFGCRVAALRLPAQVWRAPLPSADASLQATLRELAEHAGLGGAASADDDLAVQVRSRLRLMLPDGRASAGEVSEALGLSERTLHRRLQAAGTSFRAVLESFREAEAERLLRGGRLPLGEVALRLGFSDQTAWNRAFRRWKGMSPTEWAGRTEAGAVKS